MRVIGVLHLFDRFFAPSLGEVLVAPIIQHAVVQPVLVDRCQFVLQRSIKIVDNLYVAPHCVSPHLPTKTSLAQCSSPDETTPRDGLPFAR